MREKIFSRFLVALLVLSLPLTSCRPELEYVADSFRSSQASISGTGETVTLLFDAEAGTASLDLSSSGTWTAEFVNGRAYWCSLSQSEGKRGVATLTFTVQANGEYDERSASVVFTNGDLKQTIVVVQKQHDAMLISSGRVDLDAAGGTISVEVSANVDFTHSVDAGADEWIHSLGTKGLQRTVVSFSVDPNGNLERRSGTITFQGANGTETVTVYQKGEVPTIVVSEPEMSVPPEEGVLQVEVASNIDVSYEISEDCDWLQEIQTRTVSTRTYTFAFKRNHGREPRSCSIVFHNDEYAMDEQVWVEQLPTEIVRDARQFFVPSSGDTLVLATVGAIADFRQFRFESDWPEALSVEPDGDGNRFLLKITPNPGPDPRTTFCDVYREGFDEPDRVSFLQFSQRPSFSYETDLREVTVPLIKGLEETAIVIWGDGNYETYAEDLAHQYAVEGTHTIRIEGASLPFILIPMPTNGMQCDFTNLRHK